jgi:hypothetical protein
MNAAQQHKPAKAPKSLAKVVAKLEQRAAQPRAQRKHKPKRSQPQVSDRNEYLATLVDPVNVTGVGIPDQVTLPSVKFQTSHEFTQITRTTTAPWTLFAIGPTITGGYMQAGGKTTDGTELHSLTVSAAQTAASNSLATYFGTSGSNVVSANDAVQMVNTFSSYRPVSAMLEVSCQGAFGTSTGEHGIALLDGRGLPWRIDNSTTATGGLGVSSGFTGGAATISDAIDQCTTVVSALDPVRCFWRPADGTSLDYIELPLLQGDPAGDLIRQIPWTNTAPAEAEVAALVGHDLIQVTDADGVGVFIQDIQTRDTPYFIYAAMNEVANTKKLVRMVVNWEAIPRATLGARLGTTPSVSNPVELAQAVNITQMIPMSFAPTLPENAGTRIITAVQDTVEHLYAPGMSQKAAVEGTGFKKLLGGLLGAASGPLAMIPAVGPALSVGASFLSSMITS